MRIVVVIAVLRGIYKNINLETALNDDTYHNQYVIS